MSKVLRHRLLGGRDEKVPELLTSSEKCATNMILAEPRLADQKG
jgi:hypothetical protein